MAAGKGLLVRGVVEPGGRPGAGRVILWDGQNLTRQWGMTYRSWTQREGTSLLPILQWHSAEDSAANRSLSAPRRRRAMRSAFL